MDRLAKIDKDELVQQMRSEFEATMERVAKAVNAAPDGHFLSSEMGHPDFHPYNILWSSRC